MATKSEAIQTREPAYLPSADVSRANGSEFFALNGRYLIAPATTARNMLEDVACLLESATATVQAVIDEISDEGSQMSANASKDVPRILFGVLYQLEMAGNLAKASFPKRA